MYADDTTVYSFLEKFDINNVEREINYELEKVNLWLKANKLSLNVKKTKCMFFHKRKTLPHINLSLNDVIVTVADSLFYRNYVHLLVHVVFITLSAISACTYC